MTGSLASPDEIAPLLADGKLAEAVTAVTAIVKGRPTSSADRILLAELLALQGATERADTQLKLAGDHAPAELLFISQMRWLLRAAAARQAWYDDGGVPNFIGEPTQRQRDVLRLALLVRDDEADQAAALRERLENEQPCEASIDGAAPAAVRDICDLSQHGFEALALDGRYLWIALDQITEIRLTPAKRPRDLLWRKAETTLTDGRDATFFLVAQYYDLESNDAQRLAKSTDWIESVGGIVRGRGQKTLLIGDEDRGFLDIHHITVKAPA